MTLNVPEIGEIKTKDEAKKINEKQGAYEAMSGRGAIDIESSNKNRCKENNDCLERQ
ncbi:hypothetical protein J6590_028755 [Homalodisca vitripennis]|nr:hypothetical protein J6590_028755 [Homalodisca vitripennis]